MAEEKQQYAQGRTADDLTKEPSLPEAKNVLIGVVPGRIVTFVMPTQYGKDGSPLPPKEMAAVIVAVWSKETGCVNLLALPDGSNAQVPYSYCPGIQYPVVGLLWVTSVTFDVTKKPSTWHWPERE